METKTDIAMNRLGEFFGNEGYTSAQIKESIKMAFAVKPKYTFGNLWDFVESYLTGNFAEINGLI